MALAGLLAFALEPLARRLRRIGLGRIAAAVVVVTLTLAMIGGFGYTIGTQVYRLAEQAPVYKKNIEHKIRSRARQSAWACSARHRRRCVSSATRSKRRQTSARVPGAPHGPQCSHPTPRRCRSRRTCWGRCWRRSGWSAW